LEEQFQSFSAIGLLLRTVCSLNQDIFVSFAADLGLQIIR